MNIKVNGKEQAIDKAQVSVAELLNIANVDRPEMVNVQINGEFVKKENYDSTTLKDSDEVDFLYFMGGGSNRQNISK